MKIQYFLYILGVIFILSLVSNVTHYFNPPKPIITVKTRVISKVDTLIEYKQVVISKIKARIDTVLINNILNETANVDTTFNNGNDTVSVKYYFPPADYFNIQMALHNKIINHYDSIYVNTNTITPAKKSFFSNFNYSLQIGVGVGLINKQFDVYYGIGISYDLKNVF